MTILDHVSVIEIADGPDVERPHRVELLEGGALRIVQAAKVNGHVQHEAVVLPPQGWTRVTQSIPTLVVTKNGQDFAEMAGLSKAELIDYLTRLFTRAKTTEETALAWARSIAKQNETNKLYTDERYQFRFV